MLKEFAYDLGAQVCGIAHIERFQEAPLGFHPADIFPEAKSVIVVGRESSQGVFASKTNVPYTLMRHKLIDLLDKMTVDLCFKIEAVGYQAVPVPAAEPYEYWDGEKRHGRGILSLKHAAELAGLGRIGKNTLLISPQYGNRLWLGAVISNIELDSDPLLENLCPPKCRICLEACPQSALDGVTIDQKKCREVSAKCTDGGGWILACNTCRKVCPFLKRSS